MNREQKNRDAAVLDWNCYIETARNAVAEGCVLLRNEHAVLPLAEGSRVSIFGRIQNHYYKSGVGSGGMVNVDKVVGIPEGLKNSGKVILNEELADIYRTWEREHPYDEGNGWGREPWSQPEMPITDEMVMRAASRESFGPEPNSEEEQASALSEEPKSSVTALVIIGRTAGEDRDADDKEGSYRLTGVEEDMLAKVRAHFDRMVVLLNVGGIIDMSFIERHQPDAVLYVWQGGMVGGDGIADILTGAVSPSGKLTDTVAYRLEDYPSSKNFGDRERNFYVEDIYVGYRYFETFARDKVRYPFGYGLSYTIFDTEVISEDTYFDEPLLTVRLSVRVTNIGQTAGKEVVQIYVEAPQGKLGKPARTLAAFAKTELLQAGGSETLKFEIACADFASYDDSGVTGHRFCYVLEPGEYGIYVGTDVRSAGRSFSFSLPEGVPIVTAQLTQAYAPTLAYDRIKPVCGGAESGLSNGTYAVGSEEVPLQLSEELSFGAAAGDDSFAAMPFAKQGVDGGAVLSDVLEGRVSAREFVGQMSDYDLCCIVSGEGMGSPLVTPGTAAAFGGVSKELRAMGIPALCCSDGPSGIRMDCGTRAFSLPIGTLLACTFNVELMEELYAFTGMELVANQIECLLGPGMNIHRNPLNGRNFEYYSEDPLVTGAFAAACLKGLKRWGVSGVVKHFCGNNQELGRRTADAVISERALREIYLRGFEIAVKSGCADAVMTSYGVVNGIRASECYDLCTTILREEWGFEGIVMTDWWANIGSEPEISSKDGFRLMVRSQNDVFMVNTEADNNDYNEVSLELLKDDPAFRGWLRRSAVNICKYVMKSQAMKRMLEIADSVKIINRKEEENQDDIRNLEYVVLENELSHDLSYKESKRGTNYILGLDVQQQGTYEVVLTGYSTADAVAQIPCATFVMGIPIGTFTFNGTDGKTVSLKRQIILYKNKCIYRLYVSGNGVTLTNLTLKFISKDMNMSI